MLERWRRNLPAALEIAEMRDDDVYQLPNFTELPSYADRAHCLLHMAYNQVGHSPVRIPSQWLTRSQLYILTVRPAFLGAVRTVVANRYLRKPEATISPQIDQELRRCSNRARENIALAKLLRGDSEMITGDPWALENEGQRPLLVQELHHLFNAAVILMMHQIIYVHLRSKDTEAISRAIRIFEEEERIGSVYAKNCVSVLNDLRRVAWRLREEMYDNPQAKEWESEPGPGESILNSLIPIKAEPPLPFKTEPPSPEIPVEVIPVEHGQSAVLSHAPERVSPLREQLQLKQQPDSPDDRVYSPRESGQLQTLVRGSTEAQQTLEKWAAKGVTGSYKDGRCMVDEEVLRLVIRCVEGAAGAMGGQRW